MEIETSGAVVTIRSPTPATSARLAKTRPKASWVDTAPLVTSGRAAAGTARIGRGAGGVLLMALPTAAHSRPAGESRIEAVPLGGCVEAELGSECIELFGAEQRRVVHRVAGHRQAVALDGVREHHRWLIGGGVALAERVDQQAEIVTAEVGDQRCQRIVVVTVGDAQDGRVGTDEELARAGRQATGRTTPGRPRC